MPNPEDYDGLPPIEWKWMTTGPRPTAGKTGGIARLPHEMLMRILDEEVVIYDNKPAVPRPMTVEVDELPVLRPTDPFVEAFRRAMDFHREELFSARYDHLRPQVASFSQLPPRGGWRPGMCYASGVHPTRMIVIDEAEAFTATQRATIARILAGSRQPFWLRIRARIAGRIRRLLPRHRSI